MKAAVSPVQEVASGQPVSASEVFSAFSAGIAHGPMALVEVGDSEASVVTNDESTWIGATPATVSEQISFNDYVGAMAEDFVRSATGGHQHVNIQASGDTSIEADILSNEALATEVKVGASSTANFEVSELPRYLDARDSGSIRDFEMVFLKSPTSGLTGPTQPLGETLTTKGVSYVRFPLEWWDAYD